MYIYWMKAGHLKKSVIKKVHRIENVYLPASNDTWNGFNVMTL